MVTAVRCRCGMTLTKTNVEIIRLRDHFNVAINPPMTNDRRKGEKCWHFKREADAISEKQAE